MKISEQFAKILLGLIAIIIMLLLQVKCKYFACKEQFIIQLMLR